MRLDLFKNYYKKRGFDDKQTEAGIRALTRAEAMMIRQGSSLDQATIPQIRTLMDRWIEDQTNDSDSILALARYFYLTDRSDVYVYFTKLTGGIGVIDTIKTRFDTVMSPYQAKDFLIVQEPPLGSDPFVQPSFTAAFLAQLEAFTSEEQARAILCGNNHQLSAEQFQSEKSFYEASPSLDQYLKELHARKVKELQEHCDQNKVWFEQRITQDVVDFVALNQQLLSAIHQDGILYLTKIPYDPAAYLKETDPLKRQYLACHCPFVREAILKGKPKISKNWCYCSAGFEKFMFEVILDRPLTVEVIQSVLNGDPLCKFAIHMNP